ncbi:hypothetical protein MMC26_004944 [Xylographa opegraphella]|nr:hypothetical protein [Xylographa opegraphella]
MSSLSQTSRLIQHISHSASTRSGYVCIRCQHSLSARSFAILPKSIPVGIQRHASTAREKTPYTEKIRRKIWGTQDPPGQADPYGDASVLDQTKKQTLESEPEQAVEERPTTGDEPLSTSAANEDYVPATTWDGLDHIGGATGWWEEAWDEEHQFTSFISPLKLESNDDVKRAIRKAVVEVHMLKQVDRPLAEVTQFPLESQFDFSSVTFVKAESGIVSIDNGDVEDKSGILYAMTHPDDVAELDGIVASDKVAEVQAEEPTDTLGKDDMSREAMESHLKFGDFTITQDTLEREVPNPENAEKPVSSKVEDQTWMGISLEDQMMKFAVIKRVMQLSGRRIADPVIGRINIVADIVEHLTEKPKPKKLVEQLIAKPALANMPNVQIFDRRHTPIDKEKEVGRWKVIERELRKRGLPVTGRA